MPLKRFYTMDEVHQLIYESEGRRPKVSEDGGHSIGLHADGRSKVDDGRPTIAIVLAETIEQSRLMDPSEGEILLSTDEKEVDARFTSRLSLVKAVTAALNGPDGQNALGKIEGNGKPGQTFVAHLTPAIGEVERFVRQTGTVVRGLKATTLFVKICRIGNGKTAKLHLQTAYPRDVA